MRLLVLGCILIGLIVVVLMYAWRSAHQGTSSSTPPPPSSGGIAAPAIPAAPSSSASPTMPAEVSERSATTVASEPPPSQRPTPPAALAGFWTWTSDRQEQQVTLLQQDFHWSLDLRAFLLRALQDRSLSLVARNNIAAGMLRQDPSLPEFEPLLLHMSADPAEVPEWRNYTVQFLAELLPTATDRAAVERVLRTISADAADLRAATAVLHMARLGAAGTVSLDAAFDDQVLALVRNTQQPAFARATALAVAGERRLAGALDLARDLAEQGHPSDLRRSAIGVLGSSGESADQERLQRYTGDPDPAVQLVAKANVKKR